MKSNVGDDNEKYNSSRYDDIIESKFANYNDDGDEEVPELILQKDTDQCIIAVEAGIEGDPNEEVDNVVPVTILSGFLGSGKTTLIQYILSSPDHGKRIAVIENEFAGSDSHGNGNGNESPMEIESLIARDYDTNGNNNLDENLLDLIELPNGCICCTVKDSLVTTLESLLDAVSGKNKNGDKKRLDHIVIEASGMANPGPIASVFWLDEALESRLKLNGIVTLIDTLHIYRQLDETSSKNVNIQGGDEAAQQIAFADRILFNKLDLLPSLNRDQYLQDLTTCIRSINLTASIRMTTFSQIPNLDWIFEVQSVESTACYTSIPKTITDNRQSIPVLNNHNVCNDKNCKECVPISVSPDENLFCMPCNENDETGESKMRYDKDHTHTNAITSIALTEYASVSLKKVNSWLATILWPDQDKDDASLTTQLKQLEKLNEITTEQIQKEQHEKAMNRMQIFRIKGILSVIKDDDDGIDQEEVFYEPRRYIVQAVHDIWDVFPSKNDGLLWKDETETRYCKIVIIGRCLDCETLTEGFQSCYSSTLHA